MKSVPHWLSKKKHRVVKRTKAKQQDYFNGVVFETSDKNKTD